MNGQATVHHFIGIAGVDNPAIEDALAASLLDDQFGMTVVDFGDPPGLSLITSDGHPIIWFVPAYRPADSMDIVTPLAGGRPVQRHQLDWSHLMPEGVRTTACRLSARCAPKPEA